MPTSVPFSGPRPTDPSAFLGDTWSLTANKSGVQPNIKARNYSEGRATPTGKGPPPCLVPAPQLGSFRNLKRKQLLGQYNLRIGRGGSGLPSRVQNAPESHCILPLPLCSLPFQLSPSKYENCKSVLFISINPRQCAPQGKGSHGNPANSCLKNASCLMQSMCLVHLKVSCREWGWEEEEDAGLVFLGFAGSCWKGDGGRRGTGRGFQFS